MINLLREGKEITLYDDGKYKRDYTFVEDTAKDPLILSLRKEK